MRVGVAATGLIVVGDPINDDPAHEYEVVGETLNLAARLQTLAEPDTVDIDSNTRHLLGELFEYRTLGPLSVKSFDDPVGVWQVAHVSDVDSRFEALRASTTPLIGRDEEIDVLVQRWEQAKRGDSSTLSLICNLPLPPHRWPPGGLLIRPWPRPWRTLVGSAKGSIGRPRLVSCWATNRTVTLYKPNRCWDARRARSFWHWERPGMIPTRSLAAV